MSDDFQIYEDALDKAEKRLAQPLRCSLGWHKWSKWARPQGELVNITPPLGGLAQIFGGVEIPVQTRECVLCNLVQTRVLHGVQVEMHRVDMGKGDD